MILPAIIGSGSAELDFFDCMYSSSSKAAYTFGQDLKYCYVCANSDTPTSTGDNARGKLTPSSGSSATMSNVYTPPTSTDHWGIINRIDDVKSGDKYNCPAFTVAGNARSVVFIIGLKS